MTKHNQKKLDEIEKMMSEMQDDNDQDTLEKAMNFYCSMWDIREGMKYAIMLTLQDQYNNHEDEQDAKDLRKLKAILIS